MFVAGNNSKLAREKNFHYKILQTLGFKNNKLLHNPEDLVHNYLYYNLPVVEKIVFQLRV